MPTGCYGITLDGLPGAAGLLRPTAPGDPVLHVAQRRGQEEPTHPGISDDRAAYPMANGAGTVLLDRAAGSLAYVTGAPLPDRHVVHPHLALPASVVARWSGRDALHAGAFEVDGGAWGVLGPRDSGKSSLLAQLHLLGVPVLSDDVVVVADGQVLPGPGLVDLRRGAAGHFGVGEALGVVGRRERWRVEVPPATAAPLRGWLLPAWGTAGLQRVPPTARLPVLMTNVALRLPPPDPARFFELAGVPVLQWSRPRDWAQLEQGTRRLLESLPAA
ncbi:hypothetical protein [Modestobacter versicolor]|uniref:hypothetical protein n=1 Tax=Modestobacter versicolor TaxID=429133 RepID=UPI0034DE9628